MLRAGVLRVIIRPAGPADLRAVEALLTEAGLPTAGVAKWLHRFLLAVDGQGLAAVAGLEAYGTDRILRSVAVAPRARGEGLGSALTEALLERSAAEGARRVYLLTTTAEDYFPRHGFRRIAREEASEGVRQSVEFQDACPASATVMVRELEAPLAAAAGVESAAEED